MKNVLSLGHRTKEYNQTETFHIYLIYYICAAEIILNYKLYLNSILYYLNNKIFEGKCRECLGKLVKTHVSEQIIHMLRVCMYVHTVVKISRKKL